MEENNLKTMFVAALLFIRFEKVNSNHRKKKPQKGKRRRERKTESEAREGGEAGERKSTYDVALVFLLASGAASAKTTQLVVFS